MRKSNNVFNKRGVSPLIATVLLISFAVALGSVVLNWGRNIDISSPGNICTGVNIKIRNIDDNQVCYSMQGNNAHINFIIDNIGNKDVDGLGIWITGENGRKLSDFDDFSIKKGELLDIKDNSVEYDSGTYGAIQHIQLIPKVKIDGSLELCLKNSIKADKIGIC
tara:strand:+ start:297 stop:791 length:495 start_codon:yes stop_codon:yes gene_type:complete